MKELEALDVDLELLDEEIDENNLPPK